MSETVGTGVPADPVETRLDSLSRYADGSGPACLDPTSPTVSPPHRAGSPGRGPASSAAPPAPLPADLADAILSAHLNVLTREPTTCAASDRSSTAFRP